MSRAAGPNRWALGGVLTGHFLLGFVWLVVLVGAVFFTSSETGWVDLVLLLGALCWLAALALITMLAGGLAKADTVNDVMNTLFNVSDVKATGIDPVTILLQWKDTSLYESGSYIQFSIGDEAVASDFP